MATKLRRFSTSKVTKVVVFILFIIFITDMVVQMHYYAYQQFNPECLFVRNYKDSDDFANNYVYSAFSEVSSKITGDENLPMSSTYYYYYITDGEKSYSNVQNTDISYFEHYSKAVFVYEKGILRSVGRNTNPKPLIYKHFHGYINNNYTAYIAFHDKFIISKQQVWDESREKIVPIVINFITKFSLAILFLIFLISATGRKPEDKELHLLKIDYIYSEILLTVFVVIPPLLINILLQSIQSIQSSTYVSGELNMVDIIQMIMIGLLAAASSTIFCFVLLSIARKIKAQKFLRQSIIYEVSYKVYDFFKSLFDGSKFGKYPLTKSLFYRQLLFVLVSAFLMFFTIIFLFEPPMFLLLLVSEIVIIYWYIKGNNKTFEDINKGFNEGLEEQMRAERMKVDLVTNVSHDLKTPLTSIISYVELLSKEENLTYNAKDYVKILSEKSNRLKSIVSDLFDLAKSTSGNISLDMENIDIKKLIEQTIADMEDKVEKSGLQIKLNLPDKPVNIISDGKKLYRVFQNVIDNALKYSLSGTRIYINLEEINGKAVTVIKNTAGYEMNFTEDEILQRFNRGDKARTTEGTGLGLSIAEGFTNACRGSFKINIDGDLFKVIISFDQNDKIVDLRSVKVIEDEPTKKQGYREMLKKVLKV